MVKFYMAQVASFLDAAIEFCGFIHDHALLCYFDESKKVDRMKKNYKHLLLDSGAFSAHTIGAIIDIRKYTNYLEANGHKFDAFVNLDVIGSAEKTLKNQNYIEKKGITPMPVFHAGEDIKYLDDYVNSYDYVGIGGMAGSYGKKYRWIRDIFDKYPTHKFHGFGIGSAEIMLKYPFYSVDSTGWLSGGNGIVSFNGLKSCHYNNFKDEHINTIKSIGFSVDLLKEKYMSRDIFNIMSLRSALATTEPDRFKSEKFQDITEEFV